MVQVETSRQVTRAVVQADVSRQVTSAVVLEEVSCNKGFSTSRGIT